MSQTNIERMNIGHRENIKCNLLKQELACYVKEGAGRSLWLVLVWCGQGCAQRRRG